MHFAMDNVTIFWMQLLLSCLVYGIVTKWYLWPALTTRTRSSALVALLFVHVFRYVGTTELVTGMVDPRLPKEFISSAAYGDLIAAALSLAAIVALRRNSRAAIPLVWVANTWGFLDLLNGLRGVVASNIPEFNLGSVWYIYTFFAPLVIASHLLIFAILVKPIPTTSVSRSKQF